MKLKFDFLAKCLLLLFVAMGMSSLAMAQRTIKGVVTDAQTGDALIGANVLVLGTSTGTITDIDGSYELRLPDGATQLEFTFTGYAAQKVTITASNVYDVKLDAGAVLDEIVVVGYGSVKKSDLTGSVVSVGEEDFNRGALVSPDQLIQGKAAGVQVVNNSGQPGGSTTVRIRGNSSIRAGNQPLFVVDGVQLSGASSKPGTNTGDIGATAGSNPLAYLNPADIESIQVLKDASATAIYGSRGANGVILITTKKGKSGAPSIDVNSYVGASTILQKYKVLNGDEYRDALADYDFPTDPNTGRRNGDYGSNVDAFDEILQTGITQSHNLSIGGGSDLGNYRVGFSYFDQEGIIKNNKLQRYTANLSGNYKFLKSRRLGLDFNVIASQTIDNGPAISTNAGFQGSLIGSALQWNPTHPLYDSLGSPIITPQFGNTSINPIALLDAFSDQSKSFDLIARISPSFKILDNLTYKIDYSIIQGVGNRNTSVARWMNIQNIENRGLASVNHVENSSTILTHTLNLNQNLASGINLNAVVGYEYQKRTERGNGMTARDFAIDDFDYSAIMQNSSNNSREIYAYYNPDAELQSYFVRALVNVRDKYLLTATMRADGSSKFGEDNRYGYFPAVGLAWNLHNEDFIGNDLFDQLKLRIGWGQTGNSDFPSGAATTQFRFDSSTGSTAGAINPENSGNKKLKWETTTTSNIGLDFSLFDYRLTGSVEYFNRGTTDLLFRQRAALPGPAVLYWTNLDGKVVNKGVELALNATILSKEKLTWELGGNLTFISNELQDYKGANLLYGTLFGQGISGATVMRVENGQPLNAFYTRQFLGIGENGFGEFVGGTAETLGFVGDPNPNVLVGISTSLTVDKFNFSMNLNGAMGHQIYNNTKNSVIPIGNLGTRNIDASLLDGDVRESTANSIKPSSRYLEDGNYLRLANTTLSYNFGNLGTSVKNVRVYLTGQNLLIFTKYTGFDPEVNVVNIAEGLPSAGIEYIQYPSARTVLMGVNFSF
ncbi:MAG: SusC/RagA family TonB-linked outer membrane protein [Saprospiraceae bacterium]|nr:SusC/RagA family TonB-linked outer membrane protein [Saprospiraceae bacterium]